MSSKVSASIQSKEPGKSFLAATLSSRTPCGSQNPNNSVLKRIVDKEWSSVYIYGLSKRSMEEAMRGLDCLFFADNVIVVTDCPSVEPMSGKVKVIVIEDAATRKVFSFDSVSDIKFPFGLCEVDDEVHFSDYLRHSIYKIDFFRAVSEFGSRNTG